METSNGWSWKLLLALIVALLAGLGLPLSPYVSSNELSTQTNKLFSNVVQIEASYLNGFAVKADGTVWGWGSYERPQVNFGTRTAFSPVKLPIDNVKQMSRGERTFLFLKKDGTVWSSEANRDNQLGSEQPPVQIEGLKDIIAVSSGDQHNLALDKEGKVWEWGDKDSGLLGVNSQTEVLQPVQVDQLPSIVAIKAGNDVSMALGNGGEVWVWVWVWESVEFNSEGSPEVIKPTRLSDSVEFAAITISDNEGVALSHNGTVWTWRNESSGHSNDLFKPVQIPGLLDIVAVSRNMAVKSDGTVWKFGMNPNGDFSVSQIQGIANAKAVVTGGRNDFALLEDGHILGWGLNFSGQTGVGMIDEWIETPQPINNPIRVLLDSEEVAMPIPPLVVNQVTYVPLRGIFEKMGVNVKWDVPTRSVIASKGETTIKLNSVTGETTVNGKEIPSDQKPISLRGSMMVPLRVIGETIGADVNWEPETYSITITRDKK